MRKNAKVLVLCLVLVGVTTLAVHGAEQWSTPVLTKPWTEPSGTDDEIPQIQDYTELLGTWHIWSPGGARNMYDGEGQYVGHQQTQGAQQGTIVLNKDGTYSMSHGAWDHGTTITGQWRLSYPREINGEIVQAIVLLEGIARSDWAVAPGPSGKVRLLWAMYWADGSATWVYDGDLIR